MVLATFDTTDQPTVHAELISPSNFQKFGEIMSGADQIDNSISANYGTAIKMLNVTKVTNTYYESPSGVKERPNFNIFRSSIPNHLIYNGTYLSKVLERHPYTTQSFIPMGQPPRVSYLVIVALSDPLTTLPIPSSIKAFLVSGNQAVTYAAGTWHAPMVVIDSTVPYIDFAVFQYENGVPNDDCQECYFEPGFDVSYTATGKL